MVIYALPYAAGSASCYYELAQKLDRQIKFVPLELPGHGTRMWRNEGTRSIQKMAEDVFQQVLSKGVEEPYCLMGYSMGCNVCYELYLLLKMHHCSLPQHMIMCASDVPTHGQDLKNVRGMSDAELTKELKELGGTPQEILENQELLELVLPIVRNDFIAVEEYRPSLTMKMECGGTVICGTRELEEENEFGKWRDFFTGNVDYIFVGGGHFFLREKPEVFAKHINELVDELEDRK